MESETDTLYSKRYDTMIQFARKNVASSCVTYQNQAFFTWIDYPTFSSIDGR